MKPIRWVQVLSLFIILLLLLPVGVSASETSIQMDRLVDKHQGDRVHVSGATVLTEVVVKVISPDNTLLYLDVLTAMNGRYATEFKLPTASKIGTYHVIAGKGMTVVAGEFRVSQDTSDPESGGSGSATTSGSSAPLFTDLGSQGIKLEADGFRLRQEKTSGGIQSTIAKLQSERLQEVWAALNKKSQEAQFLKVQLPANDSVISLEISASDLANVLKIAPNTTLVMQGNQAAYFLPIRLAELHSMIQSLGTHTKEAIVTIKMEQVGGEKKQRMERRAAEEGLKLRSAGYEFTITVTVNGIAHVVDKFNHTYVKRTIQINGTLDSRYATAVRYDPVTDNFSFVPSVFTTQGGLTEASIQRNGNSIYAVVEARVSFEDTVGHWAQAHIERMASKQIIQGQTDRLFAPDHLITRAEFTALLVRSLGVTPRIDHGSFTDVPASSWYAEPVSTAVGLGLIEGFDKGLFQPESLLNREQMALIISRAIQFTGKSKPIVWQTETTLSSVVDEKEISNWARSEVAYLIHEQILQGFPDGTFRPDEAVSRSQAAVTLQRMLEYAGFMN